MVYIICILFLREIRIFENTNKLIFYLMAIAAATNRSVT